MLRDRLSFILFSLVLLFAAASGIAAPEETAPAPAGLRAGVAFSGTLGAYGVVLLGEDVPQLHLAVSGLEDGVAVLAVYTVTDARGTPRLSGEERALVSGETVLTVDLSPLGPGWYRLTYRVTAAGQPEQRGTRDFVILNGRPPSGKPDRLANPFGLKNERLADYEAALIHHLGAGWVFEAATPLWSEVQFRPGGARVWRARDEARQSAAAYGLIPVGYAGAAPDWLDEADTLPAGWVSDFVAYARGLVQETGFPYIVSTSPADGDDVVARAKAAAAGVSRGTAPSGNVVALDLDADVSGLLASGVQYHTDALLFELPRLAAAPEQFDWERLRRLQRQWNAGGGRADLWVILPNPTAFQPAGGAGLEPLRLNGSPGGAAEPLRIDGVSLTGLAGPGLSGVPGDAEALRQAQWLVRAHVLLLAHGADRIFADPLSTGPSAYRLYSGGAGAYPDVTYRPRPAVAAYATLTEQLAGATYLGRLLTPSDVWAYAFARQGRLVLVTWSSRPRSVEFNNVSVPSVRVTDMLGGVATVTVSGGRLVLNVDESPRYVEGLDLGILAQVLTDDVYGRIRAFPSRYGPPPGDVSPVRLADLVYDLATLMWLQQLGEDRAGEIAALWYRGLEWMLGLADALARAARAGDGAAQAGLFEVYEWLAVMAETGGMAGVITAADEWPLQIAGGTILVAEAQAALEALRAEDGAGAPYAERLLQRLAAGWRRVQGAPDGVRAAWAIVVREAAALAVEHGLAGLHRAPGVFALTAQTELERPYPGFNPFRPYTALQDLWSGLVRLMPGAPTAGVAERKRQEAGGAVTAGETGWDAVPVVLHVINTGRQEAVRLRLEAPEGWYWSVGPQLVEAASDTVVVLQVPGSGDEAAATEVAVSLLIPYGAEAGTYTATVTLLTGSALHDRLLLTIRVGQDEAAPPVP